MPGLYSGRAATIPIGLIIVLSTACLDPATPRAAPTELEARLVLFAIMNPESSRQTAVLTTSRVGDPFPEGAVSLLVTQDGDSIDGTLVEGSDCGFGPGVPEAPCFTFETDLRHGATVQVEAAADGYPRVRGSTVLPGPFALELVDAAGSPPGTTHLRVRWSSSESAHRYGIGLRAAETECFSVYGCDGWWVGVEDTSFDGVVPRESLSQGRGPWYLDVYAMDRNLYEFLTSGAEGNLFAVPPAQNVENGYGVVGSWIGRTADL